MANQKSQITNHQSPMAAGRILVREPASPGKPGGEQPESWCVTGKADGAGCGMAGAPIVGNWRAIQVEAISETAISDTAILEKARACHIMQEPFPSKRNFQCNGVLIVLGKLKQALIGGGRWMARATARWLKCAQDGRRGSDELASKEREVVRQEKSSRSTALIVLLILGVVIAFTIIGCGGGSSPQLASPTTGGSGGGGGGGGGAGGGSVPACVSGTVSSYLGTSCSQGATVYHWLSYGCTSTPSSICDSLGANGSNVGMNMDPNGAYTILVGDTSAWNVSAGESVDVVITGTVYGAVSNQNWPHFRNIPGCTGDGTEENTTTVECSASGNCTNDNNGVSDILCSSTSPPANGTDQSSITAYAAYRATFNAAPSTGPYPLTIEIKLNGGSQGTASLFSVGTHLIPAGAR
jgi:hypothetical protein